MILFLTDAQDPHAQSVERELSRLGQHVLYWTFDQLLAGSALTFKVGGGDVDFHLALPSGPALQISSIGAVWLRRPGRVRSSFLPERWVEQFVENESSRALGGMLRGFSCRWINHPTNHAESTFKLRQLQVAQSCGLDIPETLVTNQPAEVEAFYDRCNGQVIYKMIDEQSGRFMPVHGLYRGLPTMPLRPEDLLHVDQASLSLHLFQRRIKKRFDVRATVVGQSIFCAAIESAEGHPAAALDFRLDPSLPINPYKLPERVANACLRMMTALGLQFGAFDFAVDEEGNHIFFEVNPAGQFLWIEEKLGLPISKELAILLSDRAPLLT